MKYDTIGHQPIKQPQRGRGKDWGPDIPSEGLGKPGNPRQEGALHQDKDKLNSSTYYVQGMLPRTVSPTPRVSLTHFRTLPGRQLCVCSNFFPNLPPPVPPSLFPWLHHQGSTATHQCPDATSQRSPQSPTAKRPPPRPRPATSLELLSS